MAAFRGQFHPTTGGLLLLALRFVFLSVGISFTSPGSPAIDAGARDGAPPMDQRGLARPQVGDCDGDTRPDVGAFEAVAEENCNDRPIADDQGVLLDEDTQAEITLTGTDPEGADVTHRIVDEPEHGTLSGFDPGTGLVTYIPDANWHGVDTFTFVVHDAVLDSEPATVYVRVDPVNDAPVLGPLGEFPVQINEDTPTIVNLVTRRGRRGVRDAARGELGKARICGARSRTPQDTLAGRTQRSTAAAFGSLSLLHGQAG